MNVILLFIDGLGLGQPDPSKNPCAGNGIRCLSVFEEGGGPRTIHGKGMLIPTDATLGVEGLPQSATGQTTLLTGQNASQLLGRHLQGYPNEPLRELLRQHSLLKTIRETGRKPAFINAYRPLYFRLKERTRWHLSTTTVANLSAGLPFSTIDDIGSRKALYHDFTNDVLIRQGFSLPRFTPEDAAGILAGLSQTYDFVLYEYFLTDHTGHSLDLARGLEQIARLDQLICGLNALIDPERTVLVVTSDHGNIEDMSIKMHTRNRVMTLVWGSLPPSWADSITSLEHLAPAILRLLDLRQQP